MRSSSRLPSMSNRQSSTLPAWAEKSAKLTPTPSQVAPSGNECPSRTRGGLLIWNGRTAGFARGAFAMPLTVRRVLVDQPTLVRCGLPHLADRGDEIALAPRLRRLQQKRARKRPARQAGELGGELAVDHLERFVDGAQRRPVAGRVQPDGGGEGNRLPRGRSELHSCGRGAARPARHGVLPPVAPRVQSGGREPVAIGSGRRLFNARTAGFDPGEVELVRGVSHAGSRRGTTLIATPRIARHSVVEPTGWRLRSDSIDRK